MPNEIQTNETHRLTWDELVEIEPRLEDLLWQVRAARPVDDESDFDYEGCWMHFKEPIANMVGWHRRHGDERLRSTDAFFMRRDVNKFMRCRTFAEYVTLREGLLLPDHPVKPVGVRINPFPATQRELAGLKVKKPKNLDPAPIQFTPFTLPNPAIPPKLKTVMPATRKSKWKTPPSQS